ERHHPPRPAVRLLTGHPLHAHRARGTPRLQPLPRLCGAGAPRGPAGRRPSPAGSDPVTAVGVPPIPTAQAVDGARLLGELRAAFTHYVVLPAPRPPTPSPSGPRPPTPSRPGSTPPAWPSSPPSSAAARAACWTCPPRPAPPPPS